jgi:hypothetical protein
MLLIYFSKIHLAYSVGFLRLEAAVTTHDNSNNNNNNNNSETEGFRMSCAYLLNRELDN